MTLATLGALGLSACQNEDPRVPEDFISDDPTAGSGDGNLGEDGGEAAGDESSGGDEGDPGDGDGEIDISEADIVQVEGDRLYALSTYSGLTVVDMTNPDQLRALGTWETDAAPFEMYVEASQAFIMFNDFWTWSEEDGDYHSTSRLVALDAANPEAIVVRGEFSLPGRIQDSRRVGDVLYLVTLEDGWCWGCDGEQKTVVTSLDVSDEANPKLVDQLEFTAPDESWDWERSVESSSERMYVASRTWAWEGAGSFIDVVDISAGDGTLVAGAQVQASGGVFSRWQMNEHEGVLRVISQFGWDEEPVIETFTIESSQSIVPLGSGTLSLPKPETLQSARFDGDRAYAITAEQTDPLFTIDLSDPANPQQVGELEIPGWVYHMETRGDRVLALGYDPANEAGSINVSLFDVSAFDAPALRRRVHFGGDWANFAEDQNRIHKAFTILDDEEMVLVPHQGWSFDETNPDDEYYCYGEYRSGVQIIDWKDDDLALRGLVPSRGRARRALTHRDRIVTVSDSQLATFEYADRDAPVAADALGLAVQVDDLVRAGDVWIRVARDWYTSSQLIEVVGLADPTSPEPLGVIDIGESDEDPCAWTRVEDVVAVDDHVFVIVSSESWNGNDYTWTSRVVSIDIADPSAPFIDDDFEVPGQRGWGGQLASISTGANWMVQQGDQLAFLTQTGESEGSQVHVVDLSDPSNLELSATLERPAGQTQGELSVMSDTIVSWHTEPVEGQPGKVRFFFDRLDTSGEPSWETAINVPGIIIAYDAEAGRAYTIDFTIETANLDSDACYEHPKFWDFEWNDDYETGTCKLIHRELEQLEIDGSHAYLTRSIDIEGEAGIDQLFTSDERLFAKRDASTYDQDDYEYHGDTQLMVMDLADPDATLHAIDGEQFGDYWWLSKVEGSRAVMQLNYGAIGLIDAENPAALDVQTSALPAWGGCYNPIIDGDTVYCPMGQYGLESVDW
ncbi:beta-propeller domain-containing protein [Nannocystaceae bacterium ST9]